MLITVDKSVRYQQNLRGRRFAIVLLRAHSNGLEHLVPLAPQLLRRIPEARPGELIVIGV